jgi:hypothetical protein
MRRRRRPDQVGLTISPYPVGRDSTFTPRRARWLAMVERSLMEDFPPDPDEVMSLGREEPPSR